MSDQDYTGVPIAEKKNLPEMVWVLIALVIVFLVIVFLVIVVALVMRNSMKDKTESVYDPDSACAVNCGPVPEKPQDCADTEGYAYNRMSGTCEPIPGPERDCGFASHPVIGPYGPGLECWPDD